jgi:hypothetical protein
MLRHIISASLAMTACATLIATKANAVSLTLVPVGILKRNPGDSIQFILALNPAPNTNSDNPIQFLGLAFGHDGDELSLVTHEVFVSHFTPINNTRTIARLTFNVLQPVKDGIGDISAAVDYQQENSVTALVFTNENLDVEPVPEPLTIFGTATALGGGVLLKRKSSKKTVS